MLLSHHRCLHGLKDLCILIGNGLAELTLSWSGLSFEFNNQGIAHMRLKHESANLRLVAVLSA